MDYLYLDGLGRFHDDNFTIAEVSHQFDKLHRILFDGIKCIVMHWNDNICTYPACCNGCIFRVHGIAPTYWQHADIRNMKVGYEFHVCLLYTSDAADEEDSVDLGGRRIIKK